MAAAAVPMPQASTPSSSSSTPNTTTPAGSQALNDIPINPTPLSAQQEQQVRDLYYKRVRQRCADEVRACALQNTYTATFFCRKQQGAMNKCMVQYATQDEMDRARDEWFRTREIRRREREEKEIKRKEGERLHREWWGLDEQGRRKFEQENKKR